MIHDALATFMRLFLLLTTAAVLTVLLQRWVGNFTIYADTIAEKRMELHDALLSNAPPRGGTWRAIGAYGTNTRIATVQLAHQLHRATGLPIDRVYSHIDSVALFSTFVLIFFYCRRWVSEPYAVIGMLFFALVMVLTYHLHFFHPWDRLSVLSWTILIILIWDGRLLLLALLLPFAVVIKWDVAALPGLYWLTHISRSNWRKITISASALTAISGGTFVLLILAFPGGFDVDRSIAGQLWMNFEHVAMYGIGYPPLLAFGLPLALASFGIRGSPQEVWAAALYGFLLLGGQAMTMAFAEVRAEIGAFLLLLPATLIGLSRFLATRISAKPRDISQ